MTWLRFLKAHHPDYQDVTISPARLDALPLDGDVSGSFAAVVDDTAVDAGPAPPVLDDLPPANS